jgi:integrase/recombinase XerD
MNITFAQCLQNYFSQRLMTQRNASAQTISSYRDTFRLFLGFAHKRLAKPVSALTFDDLCAEMVLDFLNSTEKERNNCIRTRNARLAAIRSFMQYATLCIPPIINSIHRVLAIPSKRFEMPLVDFLSREEIQAIISACSSATWSGKRDQVMIATLYNTGARVSEITTLKVRDVTLGQAAYILIHGKGRKQRTVPLWKSTARDLKRWLSDNRLSDDAPVFPNRNREHLSRFGVLQRLQVAVNKAASSCPALKKRNISPHTLRHTTAMHLLQSGVDISVIALWLGHESPATTHKYVEADLTMKQAALDKISEVRGQKSRYKPNDKLIEFLENL